MKYDEPIIVVRKKDETDIEYLWRCIRELKNAHNRLMKQVSELTQAVGRLEGIQPIDPDPKDDHRRILALEQQMETLFNRLDVLEGKRWEDEDETD